jgi:diguanylate cyclase (GGDEF)-like protein/PAS domain S-box-containing protein
VSEAETFSDFSIRTDAGGRTVVVFRLALPEWQSSFDADGRSGMEPVSESAFDEASLIQRIENLHRAGRDASVSEAALRALQQATAAQPPIMAAVLPAAASAAVLEACSDAVLIATAGATGLGPRIVYVNPAFTRLTGYPPEDAIGRGLNLLHGSGTAGAEEAAHTMPDAARKGRVLLYARSGVPFWAEESILPICPAAVGKVTHVAVVLRLAPAGAAAPQPSDDHDPVTGKPGRMALLRAMEDAFVGAEQATARPPGRGPCLARLSIDGLAALAAQHGAGVGEAVMLGVADRLAENLRRIDTLGRIGAAEFAVCLPRVGLTDSYAILSRLRRAVTAAPIETPAGPLKVAVYIGIAEAAPTTGAPPGTGLDRAAVLFAAAGEALAAAEADQREAAQVAR